MASQQELEEQIIAFVDKNRGCDAEDIAEEFGLPLYDAITLTDKLLSEGRIDWED